MKIQCDGRWNRRIFQCLSFLTFCKNFRFSYYLHHLHPKENEIQFSCMKQCQSILRLLDRIQKRAKLLVNDGRLSNSIDLLEHRCNVACVSLFNHYYNQFCKSEISGLIAENHGFLRYTVFKQTLLLRKTQ